MVGRTLYVGPSDIHGRGCFTSGMLMPATIFNVPSRETSVILPSTVFDDDDVAHELYSPFKFLNHANEPNCLLYQLDSGQFRLYVLEEVAADEELTIHYGDEWDDPE